MKRKRNGLFYSKKEETINSISHGIGIAMGNGTRKAIEAEDHVTGSVSEGGLAQAVDYLLSMQNSPLERE